MRASSAPVQQRADDLAVIVTDLNPRDALFADQIQRLQPAIAATLNPAMDDLELDLIIGEDLVARAIRMTCRPSA